jgi:glycosyltransferase involved in cell wall biosynthesis
MIPTRDGMILLRRCVESVLMKSTYPDFELLLVDNQSIEADTLAYLKDLEKRPQVRVLRYDQPFNFSAINNFAARHARGDVLCLLNNDTEVISPHWMEEMVGRLTQTGVGVVAPNLLSQ